MLIMKYACDIAKGVSDPDAIISQNGVFKFFPSRFFGFLENKECKRRKRENEGN